MAKDKIRYYRLKKGKFAYLEPTPAMQKHGFIRRRLGRDGPEAWAEAERHNQGWDEHRNNPTSGARSAPLPGSLEDVFQRYRAMAEWRRKAPRTQQEWEWVWHVLAPVFGDIPVARITPEHCDQFYRNLELALAEDGQPCASNEGHAFAIAEDAADGAAARCTRCGRSGTPAYNVALTMGLITANPSKIVKNVTPRGRTAIWTEQEVELLAETAWKGGYHGLALVIRIAYDAGLQPVDVRQLTLAQKKHDGTGGYFELQRKKTGKAAFATLSGTTETLLETYVEGLGATLTPTAPILRHRSGQPYSKDKLAKDFRTLRDVVFPGDERRLQDLRRTSNVEAAIGGAQPQFLSAKLGNTIAQSSALFETYTPVQLASVRQADAARQQGREKLKKGR